MNSRAKHKRILYLHRTQACFAEGEHIRGMIKGFQKLGYEVDIIAPPGIETYTTSKPDSDIAVKTPSFPKKLWHFLAKYLPQILFEIMELGFNLYGHRKLKQALKNREYDFIYERYALNTFFSGTLAKKHNIPVVLEVNDATVIKRSRPLVLGWISKKIEKRVFNNADLLITISEYFKYQIVNGHQIDTDRILVVPNAIDPDRFTLDQNRIITRESLGITSKHLIGCVGAFVPWHGLEFMVESLHEVMKSHDIHALFVGDGPVREDVQALAQEHGISNRISFTGFVAPDLVPYYLNLMDICVIPGSNDHCSPVKLFEYMAMGKPLVLPKYKPLLDTISHGHQGLFFDAHDKNAFKDKILSLIADAQYRSKLGCCAKQTVLSSHTWISNARLVLSALNRQ